MAVEGVTGMAMTAIRLNLAIGTGGMSEMHIQIVTRAYAAYEGYANGGVVGSAIDAYNVGNPLNQLGEMGARLYHAIDIGNPEEIGAASLPVAMAVVGAVAGRFGGAGGPRSIKRYEVGPYNVLKSLSTVGDELDIHHAGQAHAMQQIIAQYHRATGPAIALPRAEHALVSTLKGPVLLSARSLLARDIWNLRQNTNAPPSALRQLIKLNKDTYPGDFVK
jgi:hypothetical protein